MSFSGVEIHLHHWTSARASSALQYVLNKPLCQPDLIGNNLLKFSISQLLPKKESTQVKEFLL